MKTIIATAALMTSWLCLGDVFYWQGAGSWKHFDDSANWSLSADGFSNPDSRIPGSTDSLWAFGYQNYTYGYFDLNGGEYTVNDFSLGSKDGTRWAYYFLYVRNGVLRVNNPKLPPDMSGHSSSATTRGYDVRENGTVIFPSGYGTQSVGISGVREYWRARNGGRLEALSDVVQCPANCNPLYVTAYGGGTIDVRCGQLYCYGKSGDYLSFEVESDGVLLLRPGSLDVDRGGMHATIKSGGTMVWDPQTFSLRNNRSAGSWIENSGTLIAPNGIVWGGSDPWNANKTFAVTNKTGGRLVLGGNFTKTLVEKEGLCPMTFVLAGGTLVGSNDVSICNTAVSSFGSPVSATMTGNATAEVLADSSLDMCLFTYSPQVALTKTGAGELRLSTPPPSLNLTAGTIKLMAAVTDLSGMTCTDGRIVFTQPNNVVNSLNGYANVDFALGGDVFAAGSTVVTSSDATLLSAVAASLNASGTLPDGSKAIVQGDLIRLKVVADHQFESDGELSLSDAGGWITDSSVPAGQNVVVSGEDTTALADGDLPQFSSITVLAGATLKVSASNVVLPPIVLQNNSKLLVAEGVTLHLTNAFSCVATESVLPVVEFATNTVVNVPDGMKFMNMDLRLRGGLLDVIGSATTQKGVYFGSTEGTETTYFTMSATGGTIRVTGQFMDSNDSNSCGRWFACPAQSGGFVKVVRPISLCGVTMPEAHNGIEIGYLNPQTEAFEVIFDNMTMPISRRRCRIGGKANVRLVNGAQFKRMGSHPGTSAEFAMRQYGSLTLESGSGFIMPRSSTLSGEKSFWLQVNGNNLAVLNLFGGWIAASETGRNTSYGTCDLWSSNGTWRVTNYPNIPGDKNPYPANGDVRNWTTDAFNGFSRVWSNPGTTLYLQSSNDFDGNTTMDRVTKLADIPIRGQGNLVMTNGTPGTAFYATVVHGANTSTGSISVAPSADPTTLFFNDGANWAGTVVAGNIALTNLAVAASPATVSFNTLNLAGDFPIRIWKVGGAFTNDMVNLTTSLTGVGKIAPTLVGGARLGGGETFVLGTCPATGIDTSDPCAHTVRNWALLSEDAGGGKVRLLLRYNPIGLMLIVE